MKNEQLAKCWNDFGGNVGKCCRDCKERHVGCHGSCEKYKKSKEEFEAFRRKVIENKRKEAFMHGYKRERINKTTTKSSWDNKR